MVIADEQGKGVPIHSATYKLTQGNGQRVLLNKMPTRILVLSNVVYIHHSYLNIEFIKPFTL